MQRLAWSILMLLPFGVSATEVYRSVDENGVYPYPVNGWACDEPLIGEPRCSFERVWAKAEKQGAPSDNAVAEVGYWAGPNDKGRWLFTVDKFSKWIADDCK